MWNWLKCNVWRPAGGTLERWNADDGGLLAAAVAYYGSLSVFPLLLVLISGGGLFLELTSEGQTARQEILSAVSRTASPTLSRQLADALRNVREQAGTGGPIGFGLLLLTAGAMFVQFERAFDRIWNVRQRATPGFIASIRYTLLERLRAFLLVLALAVVIVVVSLSGVALSTARSISSDFMPLPWWLWKSVSILVSIVLNAGLFTLIYRWLTKVDVRWSEALRGGLVAGVVWEAGRQVLEAWLIGSKYSSAYGVVGSFIAMMLWIYYGVTVLFLGAEYVQTICRRCEPQAAPLS